MGPKGFRFSCRFQAPGTGGHFGTDLLAMVLRTCCLHAESKLVAACCRNDVALLLFCPYFKPRSSPIISQNRTLTCVVCNSVHISIVGQSGVSEIVAVTFDVQGYVASSVLRTFCLCAFYSRNETVCALFFGCLQGVSQLHVTTPISVCLLDRIHLSLHGKELQT